MKKVFIFLFLGLLMPMLSVGQVVQISPKVGIAVPDLFLSQENNKEINGSGAFSVGVDSRIGGDFFFLKPGIHYQWLLMNISDDNMTMDESISQYAAFVKVPLNVGLHLTGNRGLLNIHINGGLMPNVFVGIEEVEGGVPTTDFINPFNLGANVGLGIDVSILTANIQLETGLMPFFKDEKAVNNMVTLNLGVVF